MNNYEFKTGPGVQPFAYADEHMPLPLVRAAGQCVGQQPLAAVHAAIAMAQIEMQGDMTYE